MRAMPRSRPPKQLVDDRGRPIDPAAVRLQPGISGIAAPDDPQLADLRMRAVLSQGGSSPLWAVVVSCIVGAAVGIAIITGARFMPGLPMWVPGVVVAVIILTVASIRSARSAGRRAAAAADLFLREGRCAGCAYVLDGVAPAADGCVVCPECGAAWKRSRIGTAPAVAAALHEHRRRVYQPTMRERWMPGVRGLLLTTDARGVAAHVSNPRLRDLGPSDLARLGEHRVRDLQRAIGWRHRGKGLLISLGLCPGLFAFGAMIARTRPSGSMVSTLAAFGTFAFAALMIVLLLGFLYTMLIGDSGLSGKRVAREFASRVVCPQCLATLDDIAPGDDGVKVCGGYNAAWTSSANPATPTADQ